MTKKKLHLLFFNPNHQNFYKSIIDDLRLERNIHLHTCKDVGLDRDISQIKYHYYKRTKDFILINKILKKNHKTEELLIDEIYGFYLFLDFFRLKNYNYKIIVHNCNKILKYNKSNVLRFIDSLFKKYYLMKSSAVITVSPTNYQFLKQKIDSKIFLYPFSKRNTIKKKSNQIIKNNITIGIIGSLNKRKNTDLFYKTLELLLKRKIYNINFKVIGKVTDDKHVLDKYKIGYFLEYLSDEQLNKEINTCNYLLSLTNLIDTKHGLDEIYGLTKDSGVCFDAYRNSIPLIAPVYFKDTWIKDFSFFYKDYKELYEALTSINDNLNIKNELQIIDKLFDDAINDFKNQF